MSCGCGHEHEVRKAEPGDLPSGIPGVTAPAFVCNCGCLELRERIVIVEQALYQLSLIVENREKAKGEPEQKKRWIGDKGENA